MTTTGPASLRGEVSWHRLHVGSFEATVLGDGNLTVPASFLFANADPDERVEALRAAGLEPQEVPVGLAGMLLESAAGERILLDAGTGGRWHDGLGKLPAALERIGCSPAAIDVVVVSHGHPDHLGGLLDDAGRPRYPNARHVMSEVEWDYWTSEDTLGAVDPTWASLAREVLPALADLVWLTEGVTEVAPGVSTLPCPGHTPGHIGVRVDSRGETLLWLGDALSHPVGVGRPDWSVATDHDPARAERTRYALIGAAAALQATVFVNHFPFPAVGRVVPHLDHWTFRAGDDDPARS